MWHFTVVKKNAVCLSRLRPFEVSPAMFWFVEVSCWFNLLFKSMLPFAKRLPTAPEKYTPQIMSYPGVPDALSNGPLTRYVTLWVAYAPGLPGTFSPPRLVSDSDMHHGTCVKHVPWCMPGSLTSGFLWRRWRGKSFPVFPAQAQPAILRIW